jgi:hypothetical protein
MDLHTRVAAILHIVSGALLLLVFAVLGAMVGAFGALGPSIGVDRDLAAWVGGLGILFLGIFALLAVTEIVGASLLLRGSDVGRVITIVFSVLSLLNVPIGTALGAYSLWALLRTVPRPAAGVVQTS